MGTTQTEKLTDLTYNWLSTRPGGAYHIKDIWEAMAREYPNRFGVTDHRKTPYDTLRVMMTREGDRFVRVGPNKYFIVTKAMTEKPMEEPRQEKTKATFTEEDLCGAGLDRAVLVYQETRDNTIAEAIIAKVHPKIAKIAEEYVSHNLLREDLIQEGRIAVFRAIHHNRSFYTIEKKFSIESSKTTRINMSTR